MNELERIASVCLCVFLLCSRAVRVLIEPKWQLGLLCIRKHNRKFTRALFYYAFDKHNFCNGIVEMQKRNLIKINKVIKLLNGFESLVVSNNDAGVRRIFTLKGPHTFCSLIVQSAIVSSGMVLRDIIPTDGVLWANLIC